MPITGIIPIAIPILINTWKKIIKAMQYPKTLENTDRCRSAMFKTRKSKKVYNPITTKQPINPHSSPIVEKIKSVLCSGT